MGGQRESNSSGEEDGDADWRKAISSVAAATSYYINSAAAAAAEDGAAEQRRDQKPKHYQIKVQKLLDDMLEKSLIMVNEEKDDNNNTINGDDDIHVPESEPVANNGAGIRLFKHSTPGLSLDQEDEPQRPRKRPKILPGEEIDEKSKKFKRRLRSVAVDGNDVISAAKSAGEKALARKEAKEAAAKELAKREEERVLELKKIRGERWLPSLAKEK